MSGRVSHDSLKSRENAKPEIKSKWETNLNRSTRKMICFVECRSGEQPLTQQIKHLLKRPALAANQLLATRFVLITFDSVGNIHSPEFNDHNSEQSRTAITLILAPSFVVIPKACTLAFRNIIL